MIKMSIKARRANRTKYTAGPGGMHCNCCGVGINPRRAKVLHRRIIRRRNKQLINNMLLSCE